MSSLKIKSLIGQLKLQNKSVLSTVTLLEINEILANFYYSITKTTTFFKLKKPLVYSLFSLKYAPTKYYFITLRKVTTNASQNPLRTKVSNIFGQVKLIAQFRGTNNLRASDDCSITFGSFVSWSKHRFSSSPTKILINFFINKYFKFINSSSRSNRTLIPYLNSKNTNDLRIILSVINLSLFHFFKNFKHCFLILKSLRNFLKLDLEEKNPTQAICKKLLVRFYTKETRHTLIGSLCSSGLPSVQKLIRSMSNNFSGILSSQSKTSAIIQVFVLKLAKKINSLVLKFLWKLVNKKNTKLSSKFLIKKYWLYINNAIRFYLCD
jgi:hypothetical protein